MKLSEARRFVARYGGQVRMTQHNLTGKILHWPYCTNCGLIALKNQESRAAVKSPCVTIEDK